jgi:FkbM family methyltransferase
MLIDLLQLREKYQIYPKTVLHVGAHKGEELLLYETLGVKNVYWIEANQKLADELSCLEMICDLEGLPTKSYIECAVISDKDGQEVEFNISNNNQSSSILELGEHSSLFPDVFYSQKEKRTTSTISSVLKKFGNPQIDFLNLDIQGAELLAMKGFKELADVQFVYTEINSREVYKGCALVEQIDEYLLPLGLIRAETAFWNDHPWGDALYIKK